MPRHTIALLVALGLLWTPLATEAQPAGRAPARIGFVGNSDLQLAAPFLEAFWQSLHDLGWIERRTR
jgi:hypothetical protein